LERRGQLELEDIQVLESFRGLFPYPLKKVTVGIRQFVERESTEILVAQRLKRFPSILAKLSRQPTMRLSQMQDVGGCRAVLPGGKVEVEGVLNRIRANDWDIRVLTDYSITPRSTGYRAAHVL
jgi:ppGpp synthetase/RelA/SpoT-type nucleotidyltranferase